MYENNCLYFLHHSSFLKWQTGKNICHVYVKINIFLLKVHANHEKLYWDPLDGPLYGQAIHDRGKTKIDEHLEKVNMNNKIINNYMLYVKLQDF